MLKKLLFVTVLLLLVSVQALAVNCDLRCSMMGISKAPHAFQSDAQMSHCHGMSTDSGKGASLTAGDCCTATACHIELKAINKSSDRNDSGSSKLLVSAVDVLIYPSGKSGLSGSIAF